VSHHINMELCFATTQEKRLFGNMKRNWEGNIKKFFENQGVTMWTEFN